MDTSKAIKKAMANMGNDPKVFDWVKAAELIRQRKPLYAIAGLVEDWENTSGVIYENGKIVRDSYTYLASKWATPVLVMYDDKKSTECFVMGSETNWDAETKWPSIAVTILNKKEDSSDETEALH